MEVAYGMHARRGFFEARDKDPRRAPTALDWIAQLYQVEEDLTLKSAAEWRELTFDERHTAIAAERLARAAHLLKEFHDWLAKEAPQLIPKHPLRSAIDYALGSWAAQCRYTEPGALDNDNGEAERAVRGIALGRKNWLFCVSQRGGEAAAIYYSFIASCHRHGVDPFAWLRDVLTRLPLLGDQPVPEQLRVLLPDHWQPAAEEWRPLRAAGDDAYQLRPSAALWLPQ